MIARLYRSTVGDLSDLMTDQPHQALISVASVTLIALEAGLVVPMPANIALAVGVEWAFLRGAASARQTTTRWASGLNWGAAIVLLIYGSLWSLRKFGAIPDDPGAWAWLLTVLHIVPVFWVTLCAAQTHAAMQRSQAGQAQTIADKRTAIDLEVYEAEQKALARQRLKVSQQTVTTSVTETVSRGVTPHRDAERAALRDTVQTLSQQAGVNVSAECKRLNISRAMWYKLLKEANHA